MEQRKASVLGKGAKVMLTHQPIASNHNRIARNAAIGTVCPCFVCEDFGLLTNNYGHSSPIVSADNSGQDGTTGSKSPELDSTQGQAKSN